MQQRFSPVLVMPCYLGCCFSLTSVAVHVLPSHRSQMNKVASRENKKVGLMQCCMEHLGLAGPVRGMLSPRAQPMQEECLPLTGLAG